MLLQNELCEVCAETLCCYHNARVLTHSIGSHCWTPPIVQVVLQVAVTDAKLECLKKLFVLHEIKRIEHVKAHLHHNTPACNRVDY